MIAVILVAGFTNMPRLEAQPRFEVASIKLSPQPIQTSGIKTYGDRVEIRSWSIRQLVLKAYGIETFQISGPPSIDSARFDILAKIPEGATERQVSEMLRSLLIERFDMKVHREKKDISGYALVTAKSGLKMKAASVGPDEPVVPSSLDELMGDGKAFGLSMGSSANGILHLGFTKLPMPALTQLLGSYLREPVVDMTGTKGRYEGSLDIVPPHADPDISPMLSSLNRLGLSLERRKLPVDILVVDAVNRTPVEN